MAEKLMLGYAVALRVAIGLTAGRLMKESGLNRFRRCILYYALLRILFCLQSFEELNQIYQFNEAL